MVTVAALFVDPRGCYAGLEGVDLWDEDRDALTRAQARLETLDELLGLVRDGRAKRGVGGGP